MKIPISQIDYKPSDLTAEDQERLDNLVESIKEKSLMHPVIVRAASNSEKPYILAVGHKRLLAHVQLGLTEIEAEVKEGMSEGDAEELSIHENLRRHNLSWYEEAALVTKLHERRQAQHGVAQRGRPKAGTEKVGWSTRDTAAELKKATGHVVESLNLFEAVQNNPALRAVKDRRTAVRLARLEAQRMEAEASAALPAGTDVNQVYLGDSADVLANIPDCTFDACITDPPWLSFFDPKLVRDSRTLPVFKQVFRVLKPDAFLYLFCGMDDYVYYAGYDYMDEKGEVQHSKGALEKIGFSVSKTPLLWKKVNSLSRRGVRPWEYDRDMEFIIVAVKGGPVLTSQTKMSSIKEYAIVPPPKMIHPNEKPIALIKNLLDDCTFESSLVLEPFGGSGVTAEACINMKRRYVIIERDKDTYEKIRRRLGVTI